MDHAPDEQGPKAAEPASSRGRRRWFLRLVVVGLLGAVGFGTYLWWDSGRGGINRMTVFRIRVGSTQEQVEQLIGLKHGDHRTQPHGDFAIDSVSEAGCETRLWYADSGMIVVQFDNDGRVTARSYTPARASFLDHLYKLVGID